MVPGSRVYVDNLFTSFPLLQKMSEMGLGLTGTIRQNRLHRVPITGKKDLEKKNVAWGTITSAYKNDIICVSVCVCSHFIMCCC